MTTASEYFGGGCYFVNIEMSQNTWLKILPRLPDISVGKIYSFEVGQDKSLGSSMVNLGRRKLSIKNPSLAFQGSSSSHVGFQLGPGFMLERP